MIRFIDLWVTVQGRAVFQVVVEEFSREHREVRFQPLRHSNGLTRRLCHALGPLARGTRSLRNLRNRFEQYYELEYIRMCDPYRHIWFPMRPWRYYGLRSVEDVAERCSDDRSRFLTTVQAQVSLLIFHFLFFFLI